jgi:methylated-DNA-[protein]-cysteine S-methyltransferase
MRVVETSHHIFRPLISSLLFLLSDTKVFYRIQPKSLTKTNPKIMSSSLITVPGQDRSNETRPSLTDLQLRRISLLSEGGGEDEIDNEDGCIEKAITPFQRKVYTALCQVPEGYVTTYQSIGKFIRCSSCQAIGQALKRNPYAPIIPCHRVIKSDRTIGGFHGHTSGEYISKKISLLKSEGVVFSHTTSKVFVDKNCMFDFSSITNASSLPDATKNQKTNT